jgi:hypothetical protein
MARALPHMAAAMADPKPRRQLRVKYAHQVT